LIDRVEKLRRVTDGQTTLKYITFTEALHKSL